MADNGDDGENSDPVIVNRWNGLPYSNRYFEMLAMRKKFPVWQQKETFLKGLKKYRTLILVTKTGSGKTTQIPQFVLEAVYDIETTPLVDQLPNRKMMVACTSTSPMAVISSSQQVALEMDVTLGEEVCFKFWSEDYTGAKKILNFLPDNVLLSEAMTDPLLKNYKVIIVDEALKRTCVKDVLLGYLKKVQKLRPDLKLVVMNCPLMKTIEYLSYFSGASLVNVDGWDHSVEFNYLETKPDEKEGGYLEEAIKRVVKIHMDEDPGDVLVFLAEPKEIEVACVEIIKQVESMVEMYGPVKVVALNSLSPPVMLQIYESAPLAMEESGPPGRRTVKAVDIAETPLAIGSTLYVDDRGIVYADDSGIVATGGPPERRIVVTTDVTETSLAIGGIAYVIDCGYAREKIYYDQVHAAYVQVSRISKERAEERSRYAGRTRAGKCFRLYTEQMFESFNKLTSLEIKQTNLACTVLTLKKLGIDEPEHFDFMDRPDPEMFKRALEESHYLGALDDERNLTKLGKIMTVFPLDPQMSKMLIGSPEFNCSHEILTISVMLSAPDCFVCPNEESKKAADEAKAQFCHHEGDHITLLNVYKAYTQNMEKPSWCCDNFVNARVLEFADSLRRQLLCLMLNSNLGICSTDDKSTDYYVNIKKAILAGFFMQVAYLKPSGQYFTVKDNQKVTLHSLSPQDHKPEWVVYNEYVEDTVQKTNSIHTITPVCEDWLVELVPHYWKNVKKDKQEGE